MGAAQALCYGEQVCKKDEHCSTCRAVLEAEDPCVDLSLPGIPVRRYGTVPPLEDEPVWQVEALPAEGPRTIAEYGGAAVFLAALGAAAVAGCLLYAM